MADSIKTPEMAALDNGLYDSISRVSDAMRGVQPVGKSFFVVGSEMTMTQTLLRTERSYSKNANSKKIEYRSEKNLGQNKKVELEK